MKKIFLFILSLSFLICSCNNSGDITGSTGGGNGNTDTDKPGGPAGENKPSWFLTPEQQKQPYHNSYVIAKTIKDQYYRIPGVVVSDKNTIIAAYDNRGTYNSDIGFNKAIIDPTVRRSTDGGKTWGREIIVGGKATSIQTAHGDPLIFKAKNGDIVILAAAGGAWFSAPGDPSRVSVSISKDDGVTWSKWKDVINGDTFKNNQTLKNAKIEKGFMASGRGLTLKSGRLIGAMLGGSANGSTVKTCVALYSDDNGATWNIGGIAKYPSNNDGDEPKMIAELNDGRILMSARPNSVGRNRIWSYSSDGGIGWTDGITSISLTDGRANAEGVRYTSTLNGQDKNRLLFLNCNSSTGRNKLTVSISEDEGSTWIQTKILQPKDAAYSSIDILGDGTIITFAEEPNEAGLSDCYDLVFRRFNLYYLTDGKEYYNNTY